MRSMTTGKTVGRAGAAGRALATRLPHRDRPSPSILVAPVAKSATNSTPPRILVPYPVCFLDIGACSSLEPGEIMIYNDVYADFAGHRHPRLLGRGHL
jgi:hypothetical protein